ncbi:MAG: nucleotidyltransferase substrate binding protein [Melioribacteraceae bacterium]|nr:nucleotidyltransferase substrate binding protein [Melioribacteraceae bacterium]
MNHKTIRWQQRYQNFSRSLRLLDEAVEIEKPSDVEKGGIVQFFEVTFELAWKTLKDYLESEGYLVKSPRETIKQAFQNEIIRDGESLMQALDDRNLTTHIYDNETANRIVNKIQTKYFPLLLELDSSLKNMQNEINQ